MRNRLCCAHGESVGHVRSVDIRDVGFLGRGHDSRLLDDVSQTSAENGRPYSSNREIVTCPKGGAACTYVRNYYSASAIALVQKIKMADRILQIWRLSRAQKGARRVRTYVRNYYIILLRNASETRIELITGTSSQLAS